MYRFVALSLLLLFCASCSDSTGNLGPIASTPDGPKRAPATPNPDRPDNVDLSIAGEFARGTTEPTIINTLLFENQIADRDPFRGVIQSSSIGRPAKIGKPKIPDGPVNEIALGGMIAQPRVNPESNFPGIAQTGWNPPDPSLAVGPNHIVETVNQSISFFTKNGTQQFQQRLNDTSEPGFFDELNAGDFVFDPKCFYDHYTNRFLVLALEVYDDIDEAYITFAISDDDDPNGIWYKYRTFAVIDVGSTSYWVDYPGLGFDEDGIYVTGNLFRLSGNGSGFGGVIYRSFDKTPLLIGQAATFTDIRGGNDSSVQVAQHFGGDNVAPYFVSRSTGSELKVTAINNALTNPSFSTAFVTVPSANSPPNVPNGGNGTISALDGRLMNVHWRNGSIWTCHGIDNPSGSGAVARWYEISTSNWPDSGTPSLIQSGNATGGAGVSTFFPAIYTDANNNAAMVIAHSSNSEFASVQATGRLSTDPLGTMGNLTLLQSGASSASGRWGDYFDIAVDPNDDVTFWMVGEYVASNGSWRTSLNSFSLFILGDVNGDGAVNLLDVAPFVDLIATGGFNAAADINGDGVVNLLDVDGFVNLLST